MSSSNPPADAKKQTPSSNPTADTKTHTLFNQKGEAQKLTEYAKQIAGIDPDDLRAAIAGLDDESRNKLVGVLEALKPRALTDYATSIEAASLDDVSDALASCSDENKNKIQTILNALNEPTRDTTVEKVEPNAEPKPTDIGGEKSVDEIKEIGKDKEETGDKEEPAVRKDKTTCGCCC
jgi:hypothetical protein